MQGSAYRYTDQMSHKPPRGAAFRAALDRAKRLRIAALAAGGVPSPCWQCGQRLGPADARCPSCGAAVLTGGGE